MILKHIVLVLFTGDDENLLLPQPFCWFWWCSLK